MVMVGIFGYAMHRTMPDISFPVFLINGIIPFFIFSNITNRCINAIEANQGLFNYRPVKPIDTVISRAGLETIIHVFVYVLLMLLLWCIGETFSVQNVLVLALSWFFLVVLSCGIGLIFMTIGNLYPEMEKFLPIIIKPLYFISAVMFPLHIVPKDYWPLLTWNPIVHVIELSRESIVKGYDSGGVSLSYLAITAILVFFIGLIVYQYSEEAMLTS